MWLLKHNASFCRMGSVLLPWPVLLTHWLSPTGFFGVGEGSISFQQREWIWLGEHLSALESRGISVASHVTWSTKGILKQSISTKAGKWESSGLGELNEVEKYEHKDKVQLWDSLVQAGTSPRCNADWRGLKSAVSWVLALLHIHHEGHREVAAPRCIFKQGNLVWMFFIKHRIWVF